MVLNKGRIYLDKYEDGDTMRYSKTGGVSFVVVNKDRIYLDKYEDGGTMRYSFYLDSNKRSMNFSPDYGYFLYRVEMYLNGYRRDKVFYINTLNNNKAFRKIICSDILGLEFKKPSIGTLGYFTPENLTLDKFNEVFSFDKIFELVSCNYLKAEGV